MSFALLVMMMLLGSSMVIAFVLQPSKEEPAASPVYHHRCQGRSLQSIRKGLLGALNLQTEPQLPAGGLDGVREQWRHTFSTLAHRAKDTAVPAVSVSPDAGNGTNLKCCSMASEIFMKDLGWDSWVIHPASLTIVQCALCNPELNTVQCPSSHTNIQDADSQVSCCQPTSQEMVPVLYVDEFATLVMSSVQLIRSCGCGPDTFQQPGTE
ncbi:gonadal somatic cell derived factor [Plectropomus leopardus]|uniref:gonadal somatic cell derived factor n=1 Tax=Plectropomus leopardus TaxID=160734 RepID=UPI001C4B125C|nr:gonadal somatic cell derived factor [Plectropomus leopardus]XP_042365244.1 gonadal somatic cell derived factor [Plectropomus leopardus]